MYNRYTLSIFELCLSSRLIDLKWGESFQVNLGESEGGEGIDPCSDSGIPFSRERPCQGQLDRRSLLQHFNCRGQVWTILFWGGLFTKLPVPYEGTGGEFIWPQWSLGIGALTICCLCPRGVAASSANCHLEEFKDYPVTKMSLYEESQYCCPLFTHFPPQSQFPAQVFLSPVPQGRISVGEEGRGGGCALVGCCPQYPENEGLC